MLPGTRYFFRVPTVTNLVQILKFTIRPSAIPLTGNINRPSLNLCRILSKKDQLQRKLLSDYSFSLHEKSLALHTKWVNRPPPRNASKRTPQSHWMNNYADRLEKSLKEADFRSCWGFTISRCTYQSDTDWAEFLHRYRCSSLPL
jgi:hypothetical protein